MNVVIIIVEPDEKIEMAGPTTLRVSLSLLFGLIVSVNARPIVKIVVEHKRREKKILGWSLRNLNMLKRLLRLKRLNQTAADSSFLASSLAAGAAAAAPPAAGSAAPTPDPTLLKRSFTFTLLDMLKS